LADVSRRLFSARQQLKKKPISISPFCATPFVVIGDEPVSGQGTERNKSCRQIEAGLLSKDPNEIPTSGFSKTLLYEQNAVALFGDKPTTPYGYYSSRHKALIMNISTAAARWCTRLFILLSANFPTARP
jgi:hypothetical protein